MNGSPAFTHGLSDLPSTSSFLVNLSSPAGGATLTSPTQAAVTILDTTSSADLQSVTLLSPPSGVTLTVSQARGASGRRGNVIRHTDQRGIYHFDLGFEYVFDAADGKSGVYFYDFASRTFFYTSPTFPFPYLYDFSLNTVLYYYPDPNNAGHYNTDGIRYFYDFNTGAIISK